MLPHDKQLIALHMSADALIWLSYVAIALTLTYMVRRARREIPFSWLFLALGAFIIACGFTHFMEIVVLSGSDPIGWPDIKLLAAVASPVTCLNAVLDKTKFRRGIFPPGDVTSAASGASKRARSKSQEAQNGRKSKEVRSSSLRVCSPCG